MTMKRALYCFAFFILYCCILGNEKCKEIRYIGGDLEQRSSVHIATLRIFLDPHYNVSADGQVIGWQFMNTRAGSKFFLGVWEPIADLKFKLIGKTRSADAPLGVNTVHLSTPIAVSDK
jgi:hypothetical protein